MRINSGDTVEVHTLLTSTPPSLREIVNEVMNRAPGGHILTGPIYLECAPLYTQTHRANDCDRQNEHQQEEW